MVITTHGTSVVMCFYTGKKLEGVVMLNLKDALKDVAAYLKNQKETAKQETPDPEVTTLPNPEVSE